MTSLFRSVLAVFAVVSVSGAPGFAEDWTAWRGSSRNGVTKEAVAAPKMMPKTLWTAKLGPSYASVTATRTSVFAMGADDATETVYCFDAATGKIRWKHTYNHPKRAAQADPNPTASNATPVVDNGIVYTLSREGVALALNAQTGKVVWEKDLAKETSAKEPVWGFAGSPLVLADRIIYNVGSTGTAVNKTTGAILWKSPAADGIAAGYNTPTLFASDKTKVVLANLDSFVCVNVADGKQVWRHPMKAFYDILSADPVFPGGDGAYVFVTEYGRGQLLSITGESKPQIVWEETKVGAQYINPVLLNGGLFVNSKGFLRSIEWKTGKILWETRGLGSGAFIGAGRDLVVLTENGELLIVAAEPAKFIEKARFKVMEGKCWTQPTLANGKLYCRNNDGDLICLDMGAAKTAKK